MLLKNLTTLGQIISGTKCDRADKLIFRQKRGVNKIELDIKRNHMGSGNVKKGGQSLGSSLPPSSMGVHPRPLINISIYQNAKYFIYKNKMNGIENIGFLGYLSYLKQILTMEESICLERHQEKSLNFLKQILANL